MEGPGEKPGMSYLETPRLPFPSSFEAAAATVNNSPENCLGLVRNEGWHPEGSGSWRIVGCRVTAANYREETNEGPGGLSPADKCSTTARGFGPSPAFWKRKWKR